MKRIFRIVKSTRQMLFLNPLRMALSLIGIAIGITSVIIILSLGEGVKQKLLSQIEAMGSNVITIDAGLTNDVVGRKKEKLKVTTLKEQDAAAIETECASVAALAPTQETTRIVKYGNTATTARIIGTTPAYPSIRNFTLAAGRFISTNDNEASARVIVIGQKCIDYLFPYSNPIGENIRINNISFEIIGVLKSKGASYDGANEDDMVFIPMKTGMRRVFNVDYLKNIFVQAKSKEVIVRAETEIRTLLRERHRLAARNKQDDFTIQNVYTAVKAENETNQSLSFMLITIAALSLLVGGVGILATMLLSVKERRSEIGLRMAVGAKTRDILMQFLFESIVLSVGGGSIGIIAGILVSFALGHFSDITIQVSYQAALVSFGISILIGMFFGSYPAKRASTIEPVRAINNS